MWPRSRARSQAKRDDTFHYEHAGRASPRRAAALWLKAERRHAHSGGQHRRVGLAGGKQLRDRRPSFGRTKSKRCSAGSARDLDRDRRGRRDPLDARTELAKRYPTHRRCGSASPRCRSVTRTLGGNIANGSPIGDSMPGLIALGGNT